MKRTLSLIVSIIMLASLFTLIPAETSAAAWDGTTATEFTGKGTSSDPYIIATAENLKYLQKSVAEGIDYAGEYFTQTADIDLGGKEWTPIGESGVGFAGVYDGLGHSINGLYISDGSLTYIGLFGFINSDYNDECGIMNLTLNGEINIQNLTKDAGIGALCGWCFKDSDSSFKIQKIYNITSNVNFNINAKDRQPRFGAILGYAFNSEVIGCTNNGNIDYVGSGHTRIGGIVGQSNRTLYQYCVNNGNLKAEVTGTASSQIGGMCGMTTYKITDYYTEFDHCVNNGNITMISENGNCMGSGILGSLYSNNNTTLYLKVHDCVNNGAVSATTKALDETASKGKSAWAGGITPRLNVGVIEVYDNINTSYDITCSSPAGDLAAGIVSEITSGDATNVLISGNYTVTDKLVCKSIFEVTNPGTANATESLYKAKLEAIMSAVNATREYTIDGYPASAEDTTKAEETTKAPEETTKAPEVTTAAETEAATVAETEAVTTTVPESTTEAAKESGCGSSVCAACVLVALLGSAVVFKKH